MLKNLKRLDYLINQINDEELRLLIVDSMFNFTVELNEIFMFQEELEKELTKEELGSYLQSVGSGVMTHPFVMRSKIDNKPP